MSTPHTPAPWFVRDNRGENGENLFHSIHDKDGEYIASTWAGSHHANAALIAAAPELLIALREALDALNGAPNTVGLHSMIESAISKAERKE